MADFVKKKKKKKKSANDKNMQTTDVYIRVQTHPLPGTKMQDMEHSKSPIRIIYLEMMVDATVGASEINCSR